MTAKKSTVRLYNAVTGLLSTLLELVTAGVRLGVNLLQFANTKLEARKLQSDAPKTLDKWPRYGSGSETADQIKQSIQQVQQLESALRGLGFQAAPVKAVIARMGERATTEPLPQLIKEALAQLSN